IIVSWPSPWTKGLGNPFHAGHDFAATPVRNCYGLSGCWPPCTDLTDLSASGGFYFQAFNGSVTLPAAGYNYNSDWTPCMGLFLSRSFSRAAHLFFLRQFLCSILRPVSSSRTRT